MRRITLEGSSGATFRCSVPTTRRERARGLLGVPSLATDEALLLPRCTSVHTFGMRGAILVARIDRSGRVRDVRRLAPRRVLLPTWRRGDVLECHPDARIRVGDRFRSTAPTDP